MELHTDSGKIVETSQQEIFFYLGISFLLGILLISGIYTLLGFFG